MRYFLHFCLATLCLSAALAGFNWWIDPYAIYRKPEVGSLRVMNERIFKTVGLSQTPADVIFIGTSRTDIGIGHEQPALPGKRLLNLSIFDQRIHETRLLIEHLAAGDKNSTIVLGLDFFAFNALNPPPSDYTDENYKALRPMTLLLSVSTLSDALAKNRRATPAAGDCCDANGFRLENTVAPGDYRRQFTGSERLYLTEKYLPYPQCRFSLTASGPDSSSLSDLREIIRLARRKHLDLRLFISPSHALQWETLAAAGLWNQWEDWKRQLVLINQQEAKLAGLSPLPLWDFSGYDAVSSEALPEDASSRAMKNYTDASHFTPLVGQRLVSRIFGNQDNWGITLNPTDIEQNLSRIRDARLAYQTDHRREIAEIKTLALEIARIKHCPAP